MLITGKDCIMKIIVSWVYHYLTECRFLGGFMVLEIRNYLLLANRACEVKNYHEGNRYYLKVLEIEPSNYMALFGKFIISGMKLSAQNFDIGETEYYFKLYGKYAPELYKKDLITLREEKCTLEQQKELNFIFYRLMELGRYLIDLASKVPYVHSNGMLLYAFNILTCAYLTPVRENKQQKQSLQTELIYTAKNLIDSYHSLLQDLPDVKSKGFFINARKTIYLSAKSSDYLENLISDPEIAIKFLQLF